jgi:hypothetical protein
MKRIILLLAVALVMMLIAAPSALAQAQFCWDDFLRGPQCFNSQPECAADIEHFWIVPFGVEPPDCYPHHPGQGLCQNLNDPRPECQEPT